MDGHNIDRSWRKYHVIISPTHSFFATWRLHPAPAIMAPCRFVIRSSILIELVLHPSYSQIHLHYHHRSSKLPAFSREREILPLLPTRTRDWYYSEIMFRQLISKVFAPNLEKVRHSLASWYPLWWHVNVGLCLVDVDCIICRSMHITCILHCLFML